MTKLFKQLINLIAERIAERIQKRRERKQQEREQAEVERLQRITAIKNAQRKAAAAAKRQHEAEKENIPK
jgi:hypothetical protein